MSSLKDKMYNYEANPPAQVWDRIAAALDEDQSSNKLSATLQNMEVEPPLSAWNKINASLDSGKEIAMPVTKRMFPILRYAAAAILIGVVAIGIVKWTRPDNNKGTQLANSSKDTNLATKNIITSPSENTITKSSNDEDITALEQSKKM